MQSGFCETTHQALWTAILPDLVLVPPMGNEGTVSAHERLACDLGRAAATVVCMANQPSRWENSPEIHGMISVVGAVTRSSCADTSTVIALRVAVPPGGSEEA